LPQQKQCQTIQNKTETNTKQYKNEYKTIQRRIQNNTKTNTKQYKNEYKNKTKKKTTKHVKKGVRGPNELAAPLCMTRLEKAAS
jgi:hypothetical protein